MLLAAKLRNENFWFQGLMNDLKMFHLLLLTYGVGLHYSVREFLIAR